MNQRIVELWGTPHSTTVITSPVIGPVFCTCGGTAGCGGWALGCGPCRVATGKGLSCGTVCASTPVLLRKRSCSFCNAPVNGRQYCNRCVAMGHRALGTTPPPFCG